MNKRKSRLIKRIISAVVAGLVILVFVALLITNAFIPVKYLTAYTVKKIAKAENAMRVTFVDAGYGDCTLVEFPDGKSAIIDAGAGGHSSTNKILKTMNALGIDGVDYLICSSVSYERCGGLADIVKYKNPDKIFAPYCPVTYVNKSYRKFSNAVKDREITFCEYGEGIINDLFGYKLCFLSPSNHELAEGEYDSFLKNPTETTMNNCSAVIYLEYGGTEFLLLGNTSAEIQDKLIERNSAGIEIAGRRLDIEGCDIVKIACHGSAYCVNAELFGILNPKTAVLSVGDNGRAMPSVQAIANAQRFVNEEFYRTDLDGNIAVTVKKDGYYVEREKI